MDLFQSLVEKICLCVSVTYLFTVSTEKRAMSLVDIFFSLSLKYIVYSNRVVLFSLNCNFS